MRISDWSSDVCSSDLRSPAESRGDVQAGGGHGNGTRRMIAAETLTVPITRSLARHFHGGSFRPPAPARTHGKAAILDTVGCALGALKEERVRNIRSEEHTSELQSLMRISYAVFCLNKNTKHKKRI